MKQAAATILLSHKATALTHGFTAGLVQPRDKFAHKGIFGHALIIAGSLDKTGLKPFRILNHRPFVTCATFGEHNITMAAVKYAT